MKHHFKYVFTGFLTLLFALSIFVEPILAASNFYESSWLGKPYIARANVAPHYSQSTLSYQDQTSAIKAEINVRYQKGNSIYSRTKSNTGKGFVEVDYTAASGITILSQNALYYIGPSLVYQNNLVS